MREKK